MHVFKDFSKLPKVAWNNNNNHDQLKGGHNQLNNDTFFNR